MTARTYYSGWLLVLVLTTAVAGQGRGGRAPVVLREGLVVQQDGRDDPGTGVAVRMFESPTLDRFLRKAQDFLQREDHTGAIKVIQDVLEGNIQADGGKGGAGRVARTTSPSALIEEDDPTHAVFSSDQRLYRPVRRLCHELLAALPGAGLALYREMYEVEAERAYRSALETRDVRQLGDTYNRYFATLSAAKALYDCGDLMMHAGRFRAAIQAFRTLLEAYPAENRRRIPGMTDLYIELKIALCYAQMGERAEANEILARLKATYPDASVRVQGELAPVAELTSHGVFGADSRPPRVRTDSSTPAVLRSLTDGLVPTWQYHFIDPEPYRKASATTKQRGVQRGESVATAAPWYNRHTPGTTVRFDRGRLVFMDHYRLRVHDLGSGLVRMQTTEADRPPKPRSGKVRVRIPVYDYSSMRVAADEERYYCVVGPRSVGTLQSLEPVLHNHLVAYDQDSLSPLWTTEKWKFKDQSYKDVTFLATPTVFGERLLVPILVRSAYALQGIEASTGEPLFRVHLHSGGSEFARAPSVPVQVAAGTAYILTNAGTVAALDAFTGELHWVRRYERTHPYRPSRSSRKQSRNRGQMAMSHAFRYLPLNGFVPSDLIAIDGRVLFGPSDGDAFLCLNGATGDVLWVASKPTGTNVNVIGHNDDYIFLGGGQTVGGVVSGSGLVVCLDIRSGVRMWAVEAPEPTGWMGRGLVTEDRLVIPGTRCLYSLPVDGQGRWRKTLLPAFSVGTDPHAPPANLFAEGPYLAVGFEGGIEVFASLEALRELAQAATDPIERANLLVQAGDLVVALEILGPLCLDASRPKQERKRVARRVLALVRELVLARARVAAREEALELLDRTKEWFPWRDLQLQLQLLRIELFQTLRDTDAAEREQDALYKIMEGKR